VIDVEALQRDFPAHGAPICFDNGSVSLTPRPVAAGLADELRDVFEHGPPHVLRPDEEYPRREHTLERIAGFLGTARENIALTRGVSEAFQIVLHGIDWRRGDRIIVTEDEEASLLLPVLQLADVHGVEVIQLAWRELAELGARASLERQLDERTRLLAISHVTTNVGYRYPARELCELTRARGIPSFVDVAHSIGVIPVTLDELGCDFAGVVSYKWMYGPYAAGALYVRPGSVDAIALRYAGIRSERSLDPQAMTYALHDDARRFEYGPWSWSIVHAWGRAIEYLESIGADAICQRTASLVDDVRARLGGLPGVTVLTPPSEQAAALVTFTVAGLASTTAHERLLTEANVRVKVVPGPGERVRASIALYTSDDDVDRLIGGVAALMAA
jgi:cysteine desulfurase / selenocysteine lyase